MRRLITLFIYIVCSLTAHAQNIYFNHLTPANGLSQISVNSVFADKGGTIWMATRMGLDYYNGNSIHVYSYDAKNPHSLFCNNVRQVVGDGKHTIYLSCSEGVACLDVYTRRFTTLHRSGNMSICTATPCTCRTRTLYTAPPTRARPRSCSHDCRITKRCLR